MKTKDIGTNLTETTKKTKIELNNFFNLVVLDRDLARGGWQISTSGRDLIASRGKSFIAIRKHLSYPRTFLFKTEESISAGYITPAYFPTFKRLVKSGENPKKLHKRLIAKQKEFLWIVLNTLRSELTIFRDTQVALPIFHYSKVGHFAASNNFASLLPFLDDNLTEVLDFKTLAETILVLPVFDRTIFKNLSILLEQTVLEHKIGKTVVKCHRPASFPLATKKFAQTSQNKFEQLLTNTINTRYGEVGNRARIAFQVSGGVDSAIAPVLLSKYKTQTIFSIIHPSVAGRKQRKKIKEFAQKFRLKSFLTIIKNEYPLSSQSLSRARPEYPRGEIYSAAIEKLARSISKMGFNAIFTGIGGDELFLTDRRERLGFKGKEDLLLRHSVKIPLFFSQKFKDSYLSSASLPLVEHSPILPYSIVQANIATNNIFIENGLWPITPLANLELIKFCRAQPWRWRKDKQPVRQFLASLGCPISIFSKDQNENFGNIFLTAMKKKARPLLIKLFSQSKLASLGYLSVHKLVNDYKKFVAGRKCQTRPIIFYAIAIVELLLRSRNFDTVNTFSKLKR